MSALVPLQVKSHIGRDLLQSAAVFKHEWLVVWEYVSNGLQYVAPGTNPNVKVKIESKQKKITIQDNGRGMSWHDLQNFFIMHGENEDRKKGQAGRGYFGTGKSAAFGIAETLRVTTIKNGKRSKVELNRSEVKSISSGEPIEVNVLEQEIKSSEPNGTTIEIDGIYLKSIDQSQVIKYIERHIAHWPQAVVYVNAHRCEYNEPPIAEQYQLIPTEEPFLSSLRGAVLTVKVAKSFLPEAQQGIAIISEGVWYESTLAGSERKDMSQFIFGEFSVPQLAKDTSPISAFDLSRSMQLNRSNELVQSMFAFIGIHVEAVRRKLVEEERRKRASEEAKKLERQASEIARIINEDFDAYRMRLARAMTDVSGGKDALPQAVAPNGEISSLKLGGDIDAKPSVEVFNPTQNELGDGRESARQSEVEPGLQQTDSFDATTKAQEVRRGVKPTSRGGFNVKFQNMGESEDRARYERDTRTIYVNLEHPQLAKAAIGFGIEDVTFKRLAYEVAFAEYSLALASEMAQAGHFMDITEPLTVMRETLNRVARSAADLYRQDHQTI